MLNLYKPSLWRIYCIFLILIFSSFHLKAQNYPVSDYDPNLQQVIAFPGAEGFGKYVTGGRGGQIVKVTNLNDSGPGSLRWALEEVRGPRIVVFEVSGNIQLKSILNLRSSNVTIAGQTAPGDGITLTNYPLRILNLENIIIRYIRFRKGDLSGEQNDSFEARGVSDMIIDHCSFSWGTDETCSLYDLKNATIQNSIIAEGLNNSIHQNGEHGYGSLFGGNNISFFQNLMAHFLYRMPSLIAPNTGNVLIDLRNNIFYNWSLRSTDNGPGTNTNLFNNYYKPGPASFNSGVHTPINYLWPTGSNYGKFYLEGNKLVGNSKVEVDQWSGVRLENTKNTDRYLENLKNKDSNGKLVPFPVPIEIYSINRSADDAYESVLAFAGANLFRDAVDQRIINETKNGTNTFKGSKTGLLGIIDSQKDVGGWPKLNSLPALKDTDQDGMPDDWELANNLDPLKSNDREYNLSPYYTDIEVYINELVQEQINKEYPNTTQVSLTLPNNNETVSPLEVSFSWNPIVNASHYQLQVSKSSDFNSNIITLNNVKNFSVVYPQLDINSTYYWRVRAITKTVSSPYSSVRSFKTNNLNSVPGRTILLNPANGSENISLEEILTWAKVPNAKEYQVQISTTSDFSSNVINQSGITLQNLKSPKLQENKKYFWRVRARNDSGIGSYSPAGSFNTVDLGITPSMVIPIRPTNDVLVNPLKIRLEWESNPSAESYIIQISNSNTFTSYVVHQLNIKDTFLEIPNLDSGKRYYWKVVAVNRSGNGPFSPSHNTFFTKNFTQKPDQIKLISPEDDSNLFSTSISFTWQEDPIAQNYTFQLSTSPEFTSFVTNISNLTKTTQTVSNLKTNTQYFWRVFASNEAGTSPSSAVRKIRSATYSGIPAATSLVSPINNSTLGFSDVILVWENQPNTENYRLEISEQLNFSSLAFSRNSIKGTRFTVTSLNPNKTYYWRVRTSNPAGNGGYTAVWSFSTVNQDVNLIPPALVSPNSADHINGQAVSLSWQPVPEADGYEVQVAENINFSNISFGQINLTGTNFAVQGLTKNVAYFWRVRAKLQGIHSAWSEIRNFSTGNDDNNPLLNNGLVGYWPMDEGSGNRMMDQSGKGNHATIVDANGVSWKKGVVDKAISLNGNSGRLGRVSHNNSLAIPKALTISAWVKPSDLGRNSIISKADSDGNGFELWLDLDGQIEFRLNRGRNGSAYRIRSDFNYSNQVGKWFHVAATFDGNNSIIYINGKEDISRTYGSFGIGTNSGNLVIGAIGNVQRFRGEMDELRLYERALNEFEIPLLMGEQASSPAPSQTLSENLVGHWKMDEGSGNILIDHSGKSNDATLITKRGVSWLAGVEGLALNLDGGTGRYGKVDHNSSLEINDEVAIAAWVKPSALGRNTIISKTDGNGFELWLDIDGQVEFRLNRGNDGSNYRLRSNFNYSNHINKWIHVAATFDGNTCKILINGTEDISKTYPTFTIGTQSGDLIIGALGTIQRFQGSLDDLRLYNRAITNNEVQSFSVGKEYFRFSELEQKKGDSENQIGTDQSILIDQMIAKEKFLTSPLLYPNPVERTINIASLWTKEGKLSIFVYSMTGKLVLQEEVEAFEKSLSIPIEHLGINPGNYLLIIQDLNHRQIFKFIKK